MLRAEAEVRTSDLQKEMLRCELLLLQVLERVCVCVCVFVCVSVCLCVSVSGFLCARVYVCACVNFLVCIVNEYANPRCC